MPAIERAENEHYCVSGSHGRDLNEFERGSGRFTAARAEFGGFVHRTSVRARTMNEETMDEGTI